MDIQGTLPILQDMDQNNARIGTVEAALRRDIAARETAGLIKPEHLTICALALSTARDIDVSANIGAPSGRANLRRALAEILDRLPRPAAVVGQDDYQSLIGAIIDHD